MVKICVNSFDKKLYKNEWDFSVKLALKMTGTLFVITMLLLIVNATYSVRREIELFDQDMQRDAEVLGIALKSLIVNVWENRGEYEAVQVINNLNEQQKNISIQWMWRKELESDPLIPPSSRQLLWSILNRHETTFLTIEHQDGNYLHTFVPFQIQDFPLGIILISESMADRNRYVTTTIVHAAVLIVGLLLINGLLLWFLGRKIVGKPLSRLVEKTERIGEGDLSADLVLHGNDELTELASALNQMCEHLSDAQEKVRQETEKRITAMEQLRHSERLATVGRLASGVAHELGTPLNVVSGRAKLIATESLTFEETKEFATIIQEQAERMTKIIRQLLDFSRRRAPQRSAVNLPMIFNQVKDMLDPIARKSAVQIELTENQDLPPFNLDFSQIQQVLINLVMNAIQAMPGGGTVKIAAQLEKSEHDRSKSDRLLIRVSDDGDGISPEHLDNIFEPFFTTKDVGAGTGLGLSIVYGIIKEHGGQISVESTEGQGTTFTILLPVEATI
jgi:signal transduction histidine kinase